MTPTETGFSGPFTVIPTKEPSGSIKPKEEVFVLVDKLGHYVFSDPLTEQLFKDIALLQLWDVFYPIQEDYFTKTHKYHARYKVHYLSKEEIRLLTI